MSTSFTIFTTKLMHHLITSGRQFPNHKAMHKSNQTKFWPQTLQSKNYQLKVISRYLLLRLLLAGAGLHLLHLMRLATARPTFCASPEPASTFCASPEIARAGASGWTALLRPGPAFSRSPAEGAPRWTPARPLTKVPAATCRACSTRSAPQSGRSPPASAMAMERMR